MRVLLHLKLKPKTLSTICFSCWQYVFYPQTTKHNVTVLTSTESHVHARLTASRPPDVLTILDLSLQHTKRNNCAVGAHHYRRTSCARPCCLAVAASANGFQNRFHGRPSTTQRKARPPPTYVHRKILSTSANLQLFLSSPTVNIPTPTNKKKSCTLPRRPGPSLNTHLNSRVGAFRRKCEQSY